MEVLILREKDDYINLSQLLKAMNMVESGAMAKEVIDEGLVKVDGEVESRYRRKLYDGMIVEFNGEQIQVVQS
ncbi:MAG: RNA-binding S4 domain-containing protein [Lachnospiraceae bacterium]|nr:RNA-binding S4 domain-containing protein [Lachnospiraceae bacterium]HCJ08139.1 RNA-binding protein [Lachnospiraceae bacterium]